MAKSIPSRPALILGAALFPLALSLASCAAPLGMAMVEIGAGTGASAGVSHTLNGITYKTFTAPADQVHQATQRALAGMGIPVDSDRMDDQVRKITAHATDRDIDIEIESLTPKTTRLRVVASESLVFKDSATATEIIVQTAQVLDDLQAARARPTRFAKGRANS